MLLEWQLIARTRPGTVDTSALPMDTVSNPGTMNAIYNFARRPVFPNTGARNGARPRSAPAAPDATCWCEPDKPGKCWQRSETDRDGAEHPQGRRRFDRRRRGDPARLLQHRLVRRAVLAQPHCPTCARSIRRSAITARRRSTSASAGAIARASARSRIASTTWSTFFLTARPADLAKARGYPPARARRAARSGVRSRLGRARRRRSSRRTCAGCHSSQSDPFGERRLPRHRSERPDAADRFPQQRTADLREPRRHLRRTRDALQPHGEPRLGSIRRARPAASARSIPPCTEVMKGGGRGYYRPPSLLSVWAYAPFMHNNAIGPEVCGKPAEHGARFLFVALCRRQRKAAANPPPCVPFATSVDGRYQLFKPR